MSDFVWRSTARSGMPLLSSLRSLWNNFNESDFQTRQKTLRSFLEAYTNHCSQVHPSSIPFQFQGTRDLGRELLWRLISSLTNAQQTGGEIGMLQFLSSKDGSLILWSLDLSLSNDSRIRGCSEASITLSRVAEASLLLPPHAIASAFSSSLSNNTNFSSLFYDVSIGLSKSPLSGPNNNKLPKPLPQVFSTLSVPRPYEQREQMVPVTFLGCICTRLISITGKLFYDPTTVKRVLSREGSIDPLLRILSMDYSRTSDTGLYTVHRQVVRTLGSLLFTASQEVGSIVILAQRGVIEFLVSILKANLLAGSIRLELVQMLVQILRSTSRLSVGLVDAFRQCGGYDVLLNSFLYVEKHGAHHEKLLFVRALCELLFVVPSPSITINAMATAEKSTYGNFSRDDTEELLCLQNQDGIKLLLSAFVQVSDDELKTELLKAVQAVFVVQMNKFSSPTDSPKQSTTDNSSSSSSNSNNNNSRSAANPFTALFVQFDDLSDVNKTRILKMLDEVVVLGNLSLVETRAYCALLQGKRPSTILLISKHMIHALQQGTMTRAQLHDAGLLSVLSLYLVKPQELPCAVALVDPEERRASIELVSADLDAGDKDPRKITDSEKQINELLCHISRAVLRLLCVFLSSNEKSQFVLKESQNFKALFELLYIHEVRTEALKAITIVANSFPKLEHRIIQSLIAALQTSGGTAVEDPDVVYMWTRVLESLHLVLKRSKEAAFAFRAGGGFAWSLSVIDGFSRIKRGGEGNETTDSSSNKEQEHKFLLIVLQVLEAALKGCPENVNYLRNEIGFHTFSMAMKSCLSYCITEAIPISQILFSIAIRGVWPPQQPCLHQKDNNVNMNSINTSCFECIESISIAVPDVICILLTDLISVLMESTNTEATDYVLDNILFLTKASYNNAHILSNFDLQYKIMQHFGDNFFERIGKNDSISMKIAEILVCLCSHNITTTQLSLLLANLGRTGYPPSIVSLLQRITERNISPTSSVAICKWNETVGLTSKTFFSERQWPPRKFTASIWFCIDTYGTGQVVHSLFSFNPSNRSFSSSSSSSSSSACQISATICKGTLSFQFSSFQSSRADISPSLTSSGIRLPSQIVFSEVVFEENKWYHVLISYDSPQEKRRISSNSPSRCSLNLYVNGIPRAQASLSLPSSSHMKTSFSIGSEVVPTEILSDSSSHFAGFRISNSIFLEEVATNQDAFLLHSLGPSYYGNFSRIDFANYCHCLEPNSYLLPETMQKLLLSPTTCTLKHFSDHIIAIFVAHKMILVEQQDSNEIPMNQIYISAPSSASMSSSASSLPIPPPPPQCVSFTRDIRSTINDLGGIPLILFMMGIAKTKEQQQGSFRLLTSLLRNSAKNTRQMQIMHGYQVAARIMKRPEWILDSEMLDSVFVMVGVSRSTPTSALDSGIVVDVNALQHLILNWYIWSRSPIDVQRQLLGGLFSLVSISNSSAFNVKRLSQCSAVDELLYILQKSETAEELLPVIINLIKSIMDDTQVAKRDLQSVANFLFATHTLPICFTYSIGTPRRAIVRNRSLSEASREIVLRTRSAAPPERNRELLSQEDKLTTTGSPASSHQENNNDDGVGDASSPKLRYSRNEESEAITHKRSLVLEMLLDILSKAPRSTQEDFSDVFPVEGILSMMQHSSLSMRIPLLLLLDLCLQQSQSPIPSISPSTTQTSNTSSPLSPPNQQLTSTSSLSAFSKFIKIGGFALLGTQLQSYSASGELFHTLFRLLIGASFPRTSRTELHLTVHSAWEQAASKGQNDLARPEVIRTILMVASGPMAELAEQHSVVKSIHQICASSSNATQGMLDNGLISGLFDVLAARIEKRRMKNAKSGSNSSNPIAEKERQPSEDDDTDEDILSLLTSIVLHPCKKSNCEKTLSEMMLLVRSTGFQSGISEALQSRLLFDVFGFFTENPRFVRDSSLVANLDQITTVSIEYLRWKMLPGSGSGQHIPVGMSFKQPSFALDAPSAKARKEAASLLHVTKVSNAKTVIRLLQLLATVLGAINDPLARDSLSKSYWSLMDNAWRLLSYVLRKSKKCTTLLDSALDIAVSKPLLVDPVEHRCCSLMISISQFLSCEDVSIREKAKQAFEILRKQTKRPTLLSVVTSTLATPMFRMSAPAPVIDTTEKLQLRLGRTPSMELRCLSGSIIDEAFRWEDDENAISMEFQQTQNAILADQQKQLGALRRNIRDQRIFVTQAVTSLQWRAQTKPMEERSQKIQEDLSVTTTTWKSFFKKLTHPRAVFAIDLHSPYRRLKLDPTQDSQRQRIRLRWVISKPVSPTLNPPYTSLRLTGSFATTGNGNGTLLLPVEQTSQQYSYRIIDGSKQIPDPELPVDTLPMITEISPAMEDGTKGGTILNVTGKFFVDSPSLVFLFGGIKADIVTIVSGTQAVIRSPPQPTFGTYEVNVSLNGQIRRGISSRYGYYELAKFADYLKAKNLMTLSNNEESLMPSSTESELPLVSRNGFQRSSSPNPSLHEGLLPPRDQNNTFSNANNYMIHRGDQIKLSTRCTWITAFAEREGDLLLIDKEMQFFVSKTPGTTKSATRTLTWLYDDICEIHRRRYVLQNVALEFFFVTGKTCLLAFSDTATRERALKEIKTLPLPNLHDFDTEEDLKSGIMSSSLTDRWVRGQISNFEYLMRINILAGRTFNDLNQYPVFPFLISDYKSEKLDLANPKTFRDLSKPMGVQDSSRVQRFADKYAQLLEMGEVPYHYGTHYSNGAVVTHFLSRLEPFAAFHVAFQSGRFDIPDRLFFDIDATWVLASGSPLGDVKELTPEFFSLPEMLENPNMFDFGERQDASRVFAVALPVWAKGNAREFIRMHREALESEYVSQHIHEWIDLIFGNKQQDKDSFNVFHPFTVEGGIDWDAIRDPLDRLAKRTQVNTWGQTPRQIFKKPHPRRNTKAVQQSIMGPAFGGTFPVDSIPLFTISSAVGSIVVSPDNVPVANGPNKTKVLHGETISWGYWDNSVRVNALNESEKVISSVDTVDLADTITCANISNTGHCFVCGSANGVVIVWKRPDPQKSILASPSVHLFGHKATVRSVYISCDFSIIVTGSDDSTCIVWDSNRLSFIRSLEHSAPITSIVVSSVNGDIFTLEQVKPTQTDLHIWSINGDHISGVSCGQKSNCIQVTSNALGVRPNVVATGNDNGTISLWNATTLQNIGSLSGVHTAPITALAFSRDCLHLFSGDSRGQVADSSTKHGDDQEQR